MHPENPFYEIRALPGKGYGCIALADIPRGTRILSDTALLSVPVAAYLQSDIVKIFDALPPASQVLYYTLHSAHGQPLSAWPTQIHSSVPVLERRRIIEQHGARTGTEPTHISIFQTNCMEMGAGAGVFVHAARFNHSCVPNACFSWNSDTQRENIHTMRDIKAGEEVLISYVDGEHDKRLRAWELRHYGFVCGCEACGDEEDVSTALQDIPAYKSAQRRWQIQELERETRFLRGSRLADGAKEPEFANKLLKMAVLLQEEGAWDARLAGVFLDIALVCEVGRDYKMGVAAGEKALLVKRDCQGIDFPDYKKYAEAVERIKASRRREVGETENWKA
ncbi:hypothetical protein C7974DRAFT_313304 [Boeremia exigua]|uniref:uncharacterized protein n=1 Tax=Boeremia exigua TaxID=749465 RepID=UPI001E8E5416|nr:uncharacterized protein C7974DRAFT_313304 [Boeremia exigua]KAH6625357.1 hypothetical protein C7974DRAFT_313304 [Boeremia exigua]